MELNNNENVKKVSEKKKEKPKMMEVIKAMTPEELEAFKRERYQKFIKPFLDQNGSQIIKKKKT
ncbi:hypothetical protein ACFFF5_16340 [Lederbergia wuyishanensis]|uniref:Uncharacterized protein n=1 Tax=Lederbergia wuyishanensis TaxID=1347903 RepID=A0ABU0D5S7_9BACI|nr:hypothetical protein [Lederbergia wuyishanensis]MCJ8008328.1 hypothetical protein [Lederbergia wuyishanensis]MDQ0343740.1 hypothetical protein [Lederbergia wuyishanensis]